jgi:hypothetical protein
METYEVEVIRPGVTKGVSEVVREYPESELRDSVKSLKETRVTDTSRTTDVDGVIGKVTDAWYEDGIKCTVEIFSDEMVEQIDKELLTLAPSMTLDSDENENPTVARDIKFRHLFLAPQVSGLVGSMERVE